MAHEFKKENPKEITFTNAQALHGDVIIERIDSMPDNFKTLAKQNDDCLAYGEFTGHKHKLFRMQDTDIPDSVSFDLRSTPDGIKFLHVEKPVMLSHQEHDAIIIPPGDYKIGIQKEYDPFTNLARNVAD